MSRRTIFAVLAVVAVVALGFLGVRRLRRAGSPSAGDLQTATVQRGELVAMANTVGTVETAGAVSLVFQAPGQVKLVTVAEGEQVKAGQEIARLDTADAELQVAQAEAGLAMAQAGLQQVTKAAPAEDVAAARAALASAQEALKRIQAGPTETDLEIARLRWEQAKDQLWGAQSQRDSTCGNPLTSGNCDNANAGVASAELAVEIARLQYEEAQKGVSAADILAAEAQVAQAQASLARLTTGASQEDLAAAQAQVQQADVAVQMARRSVSQMTLQAPLDGTVTHLDLQVGQVVGPSVPVGELASTGQLEIVADMSEVDIARLQVGQEAEITLDALPERTFNGHVAMVAVAGLSAQGVVNFPVTVRFDEDDPAVKPGMTANVSIITGRRQNVLLAPNRAIRTRSGDYIVQLLRDGQVVAVPVQVGLSGDGNTEVLGDSLAEGDVLVLNAGIDFQHAMPGGMGD